MSLRRPAHSPSEIRLGTTLSDAGRVTVRPTVRAAGPTQGRLGTLCDALSVALEFPVVPHAVNSYTDLLAGLHWGEIHFAWLPPMIAVRAIARGSAVALAAPVRSGSAWYWTALFSHHSSNVRDLSQLSGVRAAWVDPMSSAGYLVIRASMRAAELELSQAFASEAFYGTHDAVVAAVREGRADVGATYAHFDDAGRIRNAGWGKTPVNVIKCAGPIPSDVLAASVHLPEDVAREIAEALTGEGHSVVRRAATELLEATGFVAVKDEHLAHLEELVQYLEVPPSTR
ncbi:MAG: phosphate/phosphite/phosphonate ABC transporter substrate-binding protein [Polyangiaceae bacterium]|nr:phosphate/phosphite/phosphonate ABC transporter substrate-binding protein [Polyangiaceae bacterium]